MNISINGMTMMCEKQDLTRALCGLSLVLFHNSQHAKTVHCTAVSSGNKVPGKHCILEPLEISSVASNFSVFSSPQKHLKQVLDVAQMSLGSSSFFKKPVIHYFLAVRSEARTCFYV